MTPTVRPARPPRGGGPGPDDGLSTVDEGMSPHGDAPRTRAEQHRHAETGALSLEAVLVLPALAMLVMGLLGAVGVVRDVLVLHEAARVGARAAATTSGAAPVVRAVEQAVPELPDVRVTVTPTTRRDGDLVRVLVEVDRRLGPVTHRLRATTVARVEPVVGPAVSPP
jgi:hypothetical protein